MALKGGGKKKKQKHKKPPSRLMMAPVGPGVEEDNYDGDNVVVVEDGGEQDGWGSYREGGSLEDLMGGKKEVNRDRNRKTETKERDRRKKKYQKGRQRRDSRRVVSGPLLEEGGNKYWEYRLTEKEGGGGGRHGRGGSSSRKRWSRRRKICR